MHSIVAIGTSASFLAKVIFPCHWFQGFTHRLEKANTITAGAGQDSMFGIALLKVAKSYSPDTMKFRLRRTLNIYVPLPVRAETQEYARN
jgi:hypothetical protein